MAAGPIVLESKSNLRELQWFAGGAAVASASLLRPQHADTARDLRPHHPDHLREAAEKMGKAGK